MAVAFKKIENKETNLAMKYLITIALALFAGQLCADNTTEKSDMLGLRTTVYMVDDVNKAKQWYSQAFGIKPYFDEPYYVGFNIRGFELGLMPSEPTEQSSGVISYWGVEDIQSAYDKLISLGATPLSPVSDVGGGIKLGVVTDPFGNPLGVIYNPLFKTD